MTPSPNHRASCFIFLLVTAIVSFAATWAALVVWQRMHPMPVVPGVVATLPAAATDTLTPLATAAQSVQATRPAGPLLMTIVNVISAGTLSNEVVMIKNDSSFSVSLAGWQLGDGEGDSYVFPALELNPDGAIQVHTGPGADTAIDLYWNRDTAVWQVGKTVTLSDNQGVVHATYTIK